ncbi:hypothetical protein JDV02_002216 [Purpureocillium takamizusanense]|uniref:Glycine-rich domain-containing protein 1 n=1 Tax=Purpureocillium takamizusanense TaxID=2060973 RepID=A0A9Q8V8B8_9HYPO|nr:uncharacterized protein JDV02_002216 [Purpureocillium takamizusanense]UNI15709.1 hypothetical protein JDV02_002216 [Purpureocillium takamizusanense]
MASTVLPSKLKSLHQASKTCLAHISTQNPILYKETFVHYASPSSGKEHDAHEAPSVPDDCVFKSLSLSAASLPTVAQCAVHLELLEVFYALRSQIISSTDLDDTFGLERHNRTVYRRKYDATRRKYVNAPVKLRDATWDSRRKEKWTWYLELAAGRFLAWAVSIDRAVSPSASQRFGTVDAPLPYLPPLDVLMVWHAYLLNPADFEEYCVDNSLRWLRRVPFPWSQIHAAMDSKDSSYTVSDKDRTWLTETVKLEADLFQYLRDAGIASGSVALLLKKEGSLRDMPNITAMSSLDGLTPREQSFVSVMQRASAKRRHVWVLVDNVERQASFVSKMHSQLWLRSPALEGTLQRAVTRYGIFLELFALHPKQMLVPTLDIDLAWHTHQLSAGWYRESMVERCGRFIDHDDKLPKSSLAPGMDRTAELYRAHTGREYSVCQCWDCEAIASALEACVLDDTLDGADVDVLARQVANDVQYYRAVEHARRRKVDPPNRRIAVLGPWKEVD